MKTLSVIKVVGLVLFVIQLCGIDFANSMSVNTEILKNVTQVEDHSKNLLEDSKETVLFSFKNDVESIQPSDIS
uniref:Uncharacterized protein n=1 Tax=Megaselia scalaris TaxID=36166 RepID=T1GGH9_MEGSC